MAQRTRATTALAEPPAPASGPAPPGTRAHPKRRRRIVLTVLAVVVALPVAGWVAFGLLRDDAEPVSLAEASYRFHAEHPGESEGAGPLQPAEGVYRYRGTGSDHISVPSLTQAHGPGIPGTVTHEDGCWTLRIDYSSNHWQDWTFCPQGDSLVETGGRTFQRWDLGVTSIESLATFACESQTLVAGMQPGDRWRQTCTGRNTAIDGVTTSAGRMRFAGIEDVRVGTERVAAYHLVQKRTVSGAQRGKLHADLWVAPDGLPLRVRHSITVATDSPIGDITYDESTDFSLTSLEPRR